MQVKSQTPDRVKESESASIDKAHYHPMQFFQSCDNSTVEPRFNEPLFNEVLDITSDILRPGQSYSKMSV